MNKKILDWIILTVCLLLMGLSFYSMINQFIDSPRNILNTYEVDITIDYSDSMDLIYSKDVNGIVAAYNDSKELQELLFVENDNKGNQEEPDLQPIQELLGLDDYDNIGRYGYSWDRSDIYQTGVGVAILNVSETGVYHYEASVKDNSPTLATGDFRWGLIDTEGNEYFYVDDFREPFQKHITLEPGRYFLYHEYETLEDGLSIKLSFN